MSVHEFLWRLNFLLDEGLMAIHHFSKNILVRIDHRLLTIVDAYETRPALGVVILTVCWPLHLFQGRPNSISLLGFLDFIITYWFCHLPF